MLDIHGHLESKENFIAPEEFVNTLNQAFIDEHSIRSIENSNKLNKNLISFEFRDNMESYYDDMSSDANFEISDNSNLLR